MHLIHLYGWLTGPGEASSFTCWVKGRATSLSAPLSLFFNDHLTTQVCSQSSYFRFLLPYFLTAFRLLAHCQPSSPFWCWSFRFWWLLTLDVSCFFVYRYGVPWIWFQNTLTCSFSGSLKNWLLWCLYLHQKMEIIFQRVMKNCWQQLKISYGTRNIITIS